jgi:glycosyltransferase involved in cell wall biosynthesis
MSIHNELVPVDATPAAPAARALQFRAVVPQRTIATPAAGEPAIRRSRSATDVALRVCHVMPGDLWAGAEMHLLMTARFLSTQPNVAMSVVLFNEGRLARELRQIGVHVTVLDEARIGAIALVQQLTGIFRAERINVVHTHKYKDGVLGALAAWRAGVPHFVRTMHGFPEPMSGWNRVKSSLYYALDRRVLRHSADLIIAVSRRMAEDLRESGFRPTMVTWIHNGVDVRQVRAACPRDAVRRELGIDHDVLLIGTAGRLSAIKGQEGLLRAAARILETHPTARFLIVGDGPLGSHLLSTASALRIDHACHFLGPRADVFDVMAALDIFVLPSLNEGIPMALLEAMTLGTPVVAAAVGGIPEVVQHRVNGLLVPAADDQALADACLELAADPSWAQALAAQARRSIADGFSHECSGEALLYAYRGLTLVANARGDAR